MPALTEQEILDRWTSRLDEAKSLRDEGLYQTTNDALASLGAAVPDYARSDYDPAEHRTSLIAGNVQMTPEGIQAINPSLPVRNVPVTNPVLPASGLTNLVTGTPAGFFEGINPFDDVPWRPFGDIGDTFGNIIEFGKDLLPLIMLFALGGRNRGSMLPILMLMALKSVNENFSSGNDVPSDSTFNALPWDDRAV